MSNQGHIDAVVALLALGACASAVESTGCTPLDLVHGVCGRELVAERLMEATASQQMADRDPLQVYMVDEFFSILRLCTLRLCWTIS